MSGIGVKRVGLIVLVVSVVVAGGLLVASDIVDAPFTDVQQVYAVGIYTGTSPLALSETVSGPILSRADVGDEEAIGVADPWLVVDGEEWLLFVEVIRREMGAPNDQHGVIGLATSYDSGEKWAYQGVVLEEPWHLSYPNVFSHEGSFFMLPESMASGEVVLYEAEDFPTTWREDTVLLRGDFVDPTIFPNGGRWWLFVTGSTEESDDTLRLFHAEELRGPYEEHPASPIVTGDVSKARSAGPVVATPEGLIRFAQDNRDGYGRAVRGFQITSLTTTKYAERDAAESPVLTGSGEGWNADGMHHIAPVQLGHGAWVSPVDGYYEERVFGLDR